MSRNNTLTRHLQDLTARDFQVPCHCSCIHKRLELRLFLHLSAPIQQLPSKDLGLGVIYSSSSIDLRASATFWRNFRRMAVPEIAARELHP
jgi:hypothetical protein